MIEVTLLCASARSTTQKIATRAGTDVGNGMTIWLLRCQTHLYSFSIAGRNHRFTQKHRSSEWPRAQIATDIGGMLSLAGMPLYCMVCYTLCGMPDHCPGCTQDHFLIYSKMTSICDPSDGLMHVFQLGADSGLLAPNF